MKKNGFTLIELLAVIIILGILMIIAIPSVTKYISDSRKSTYIDTAKEIISGARNMVNDGSLEMFDTDTSYYIDVNCIKTESGTRSPYGEFTEAYVVVNYDGNGYEYYWTGVDDAGQGIKNITKLDKLDTDAIESDLQDSDISHTLGVNGRHKYMVIDKEHTNCGKGITQNVTDNVSGNGNSGPVEYPKGKNKSSVTTGDLVKIGNEEFYVIRNDSTNLVLLSHYNLKVGNISQNYKKVDEYKNSDSGYGLQSSEARGYVHNLDTYYGTMSFSSMTYWNSRIGTTYPGSYCNWIHYSNYPTDCAYVYDNGSKLKPYIDSYKNALEEIGVTIKEARLLRAEEAFALGCGYSTASCNNSIGNAFPWVYETSYWLGSPTHSDHLFAIKSDGSFMNNYYNYDYFFGVRPVIVI